MTTREQTTGFIRDHSFNALKGLLGAYYNTPIGTVVFNEDTDSLEAVGMEPSMAALTKVEFMADIHGQSQDNAWRHSLDYGRQFAFGDFAAQKAILEAHASMNHKLGGIFNAIGEGDLDHRANPYWEMRRSLRDSKTGQPVKTGFGIEYAAKALVGDIVISSPFYSAEISDGAMKQLIRGAFSLSR